MNVSQMEINIEEIKGPSAFITFSNYLQNSDCPKNILPFQHEFDLILEKYKKESEGLGVFVFKQQERVIGYAPYICRRSILKMRLGEKVVYSPKFDAIQILRPNSSQWGNNTEVPRNLLLFFSKQKPEYAICATEIRVGSEIWHGFQSIGTKLYLSFNNRPFVHYFHYFEDSYDTFYRKKSKSSRSQIRYKTNRLRKKVGPGLRFEEYSSEVSVEAFLKAANSISVKTYQARLFGEVIENSDDNRKLLTLYGRYGYFRSFVLWADQLPISFILGFQTADGVYELAVMGYDPDWYEYNPGFNCNIMLLKCLYENNTPHLMDPGGGDNDLKRLLCNKTKKSVSPVLFPKTPYGTALYYLGIASDLTNRWTVSILKRIGIKNKIKRWFRK